MSDRRPPVPPEDDEDASSWLASQFDPTGQLPKQPPAPVPPAAGRPSPVPPAAVPPAAVPPTAVPPPSFGAPARPQPAAVPPASPAAQQPAAVPPAFPAAQQPVQPTAAPPPAPGGGFSWGLSPGATPAVPPTPATPASPSIPPTPPAASTPPPPSAWFEPVGTSLDTAIPGVPVDGRPPAAAQPFETTVLPDVAPDSRDAPPFWEPEPTQMMDVLDLEPDPRPTPAPKQPFTRSVFPEGTQLLPDADPAPLPTAPPGETGQVSAIDALFGESQFREYTGVADPSENPFIRRAEAATTAFAPGPTETTGKGPRPPAAGVSKLQRILLTVLGSMLAVLLLVALFFVGIRLPGLLGPSAAVNTPSPTPTTPTEPTVAVGPVAPGDYHWDQLLGGECLDPFTSAWQDDYTVVDCTVPHAGQLVHIGTFPLPDAGVEAFPGEEELQTRALTLCREPGIFSSAVSDLKKDAQVTVSYPLTAEDWDAGKRTFSCFVSRVSGEPITEDVALPQQAPVTDATPTPTATTAP